jgi:hypothetical protein
MGTWGEGPFDNDGAGDMISGMMRPIEKVVRAANDDTARRSYLEARANARFIVMAHGTDILGGPPIETVLRALARIRSDAEWLGGWRSPASIAARIGAEMREILDVMESCAGCKRSKLNLSEMASLIDAAMLVVPAKIVRKPKPSRTRALAKRKRRMVSKAGAR